MKTTIRTQVSLRPSINQQQPLLESHQIGLMKKLTCCTNDLKLNTEKVPGRIAFFLNWHQTSGKLALLIHFMCDHLSGDMQKKLKTNHSIQMFV